MLSLSFYKNSQVYEALKKAILELKLKRSSRGIHSKRQAQRDTFWQRKEFFFLCKILVC